MYTINIYSKEQPLYRNQPKVKFNWQENYGKFKSYEEAEREMLEMKQDYHYEPRKFQDHGNWYEKSYDFDIEEITKGE